MIVRYIRCSILLLFCCAVSLPAQERSSHGAQVTVLSTSEQGVSVRVAGLRPRVLNGVIRHNVAAYSARFDSLSPSGLRFTLGIPPDAVNISATVEGISDTVLMLPGINSGAVTVADGAPGISVSSPSVLRHLRTVVVRYEPLRYLGGKRLRVTTDAVINVAWDRREGSPKEIAATDFREIPALDRQLEGLILNYSEAKRWRRYTAPRVEVLGDETWGMGTAAVLLAPEDGIYRVTATELTAAGVQGVVGASVADLSLTMRGEPVPIYVSSDGVFGGSDFIEFRGERNRGVEGFYRDETTDTNAYILRWDGSASSSKRIRDAAFTSETPLMWYDSTLHFEVDSISFHGYNLPGTGDVTTLHVPERVQGERYYWGRSRATINGGVEQVGTYFFECSPYYQNGGTVTLRMRLVGMDFERNRIENPPIVHRISVRLNTFTDLGVITVTDSADVLRELEIPVSTLLNGRNSLTLRPEIPDRAGISYNVMLDYFELDGKWIPTAWSNETEFRLPSEGEGPYRVTVDGLTVPPTTLLTDSLRVSVTDPDVQRGHLIRVTARDFVESRYFGSQWFAAQTARGQAASPAFALGLHLVEFDPVGNVIRQGNYSTIFATESEKLEALKNAGMFLEDVGNGNYIVAGTSVGFLEVDGSAALQSEGEKVKARLAALGSAEMAGRSLDRLRRANWAFAARVGNPGSAQESIAENRTGTTLNAFFPATDGADYRAVTYADGSPHQAVALAARRSASGIRNHSEDQLIAAENQADMLIVTHPNFAAASEKLAAHRRDRDGLSVRVVDVNTIYDEFNYGIKSAEALRRFFHYAGTEWTKPEPGYVLLMGDASVDPAMRTAGAIMADYIPTPGIPAADYLYTIDPADTTDFQWLRLVGRLPASTSTEAFSMIDKIIEYDGLPPAEWNKRFLFLAGGQSEAEVAIYNDENVDDAGDYIARREYDEFQGDTIFIQRSARGVDLQKIDKRDADRVQREINKGVLWVTLTGHGAVDVLDLDFGYAEELNNQGKYPILATWSCQTGLFAHPYGLSRNENFNLAARKGAVATIGATSFSFTDIDDRIKDKFYGMLTTQPFQINLGFLFTQAKYAAARDMIDMNGLKTYHGIRARNHLMTYHLLGDPAMNVAVRKTVELALPEGRLSGENGGQPGAEDTVVVVTVDLWNYGKPLAENDTLLNVEATIINKSGERRTRIVEVDGLKRWMPVDIRLPVDGRPGQYTVRVEANPGRLIEESYYPDNVLSLPFVVQGDQPLPIEPVPFGRVTGYENVAIRLLNPPTGPGAHFEVDTSDRFDSPVVFSNDGVGGIGDTELRELVTTWTFSIPENLRSARKFWWRARSTAPGSTDPDEFPLVETFTVEPASGNEFIIGSEGKSDSLQMAFMRRVNAVNRSSGVGPGTGTALIRVVAIGQSYLDSLKTQPYNQQQAFITADGADVLRLPRAPGFNVVILPPGDLEPVLRRNFLFYGAEAEQNVDDFITVMDTLSDGYVVLLATAGESFQLDYRTQDLLDALYSVGSSYATDVDVFGTEDSYALIGVKGSPGQPLDEKLLKALELRRAGQDPPFRATAEAPIAVVPKAGTATSPVVGPAKEWSRASISYEGAVPPAVVIYGVRRDGIRDSLFVADEPSSIPLGSIDVEEYPRLELQVRFENDTTQRVQGIAVEYAPSPELALVPSTVEVDPDSVLQGDPATFAVTVANLSRRFSAENIALNLIEVAENQNVIGGETFAVIPPDDSARAILDVGTTKMRSDRVLTAVVNDADIPAEPYRHNNRLSAPLRIGLDNLPPGIEIYADGRRLMNGDFVAPTAEFEVRIYDNSMLSLTGDSATIRLVIDNEQYTPTSPGARFEPVLQQEDLRARFFYRPGEPMESGEHQLLVLTADGDRNSDRSDILEFRVERGFSLTDVANVPNPFAEKTVFTFMVGGALPPTSGEIAIFTVAGRKIKTIRLDPAKIGIGFNRVEWDGRDEDFDRLANGVYYYRVTIDNGQNKQQVIEKLVVLK